MFKKLGWFFRQERKSYLWGIVMLIGVATLQGLVPFMIGRIIDTMKDGSMASEQLIWWVISLVIIGIVQYVLRYFWRMNIFGTSAKLDRILRSRIFKHLTDLDDIFYHEYRTGDLMARMTNDLFAIRMVASSGVLTLVDSLTQSLITLFFMFVMIDWRLTLVSILPLPLLTILIRVVGQKLHYHSRRGQAAFSSMNDKVQESVTGVKVIKTFGEEALDVEDFKKMTADVVAKNKEVYYYDAAFQPTSQLIMGLATMLGVFFGGFLVVRGDITIGLLISFISYIARLNWPMIAIGRLFNILERGSASYDRIEEILNVKSNIIENPKAINAPIEGSLDVNIESFKYFDAEHQALEDIIFSIPQGHTFGVVGKTGAGKTTIFKLLMRDYDNYRGSIRYNDRNIKDYTLDALLTNIGYVPQDNFLFSTTVRENIRFGRPDATDEEVERVAQLASVHDDIIGFPDGYDTLVGERGVALSGGQQQRISIARAILMDPSLLILDDSLSAVDAKTEEAILDSVRNARDKKTTIIAAHRLSSVMHADEIIVVEDGRIVERGTHDTLVELGGWYNEMYTKQQLELQQELEETVHE